MGADEPRIDITGARGVQVGDHQIQVNTFYRPTTSGPLVVGDIPARPVAFQPREDQLAALRLTGPGITLTRALTGLRGAGKTQLAAAYARECVAAGWRLVAWVDADEIPYVLSFLSVVARRLGIAEPTDNAELAARRVRNWLEADGERCLLVFDNVTDLDALRPYLPAAGSAQVVLTGTSSLLHVVGAPTSVGVFTEEEALAFLAERTGLADEPGAAALAAELGFLPLALAQAAAVISAQRLGYETYLERLRSVPLADYLRPAPGEPYPHGLPLSILLSIAAVTDRDPTGLCQSLLDLVAVLSPLGVSRALLNRAGRLGVLTAPRGRAQIDEAAAQLTEASLLSWSVGDVLTAHSLVARVVRERCAQTATLTSVAAGACTLLEDVSGSADSPSPRQAEALNTVAHIVALSAFLGSALPDDNPVTQRLLRLRGWALRSLLELGDVTSQAIGVGESLVSDAARLLGEDHRDTLAAEHDLALAYQSLGRLDQAASLFEQVAADRQRLLGPDHPDTLTARSNLALAYQSLGRLDQAASLFEQVAADRQRLLGPDHPDTLTARSNLALAYQSLGRLDQAASLFEQVAADRQRLLGPDHPDTLTARSNLALAYQSVRRTGEAITLFERVAADRERVLGPDHPDTLTARSNLAVAYQRAGRTDEAIKLFERALVGLERVLGPGDQLTVAVRQNLSDARKAIRARPRVFISHATEQDDIVGQLARALRSRDLDVIDVQDEIRPGEDFRIRLSELVSSADVMLVIVPAQGIDSTWVGRELDYALRAGRNGPVIVPVFTGAIPPSSRLPYGLAERQGIRLSSSSDKSFVSVARQVAEVAARETPRISPETTASRTEGQLTAAELADISQLVTTVFSAAGRRLTMSGQPQLLEPGPVWISAETVPGPRELQRFSARLSADSVGYFVHVGDLPASTDKVLDQMRVGGKRVVTVQERALRAALADGGAKTFLNTLEVLYYGQANLFDAKNALIDDRFFFGRDAILTTIGQAIKRDEHILISGTRKVGKTSVLNILRQHLADHPVCLVDLERFDRNREEWPGEFFRLIIEAVDRWARIEHEEWPFELTPPATGSELTRQLEERFDYLGGNPAGQRVVVMLDEIERVFPKKGEAAATRRWIQASGALRSLAQSQRRYVVVIGADLRAAANRENDLGNGETNPFFSFFQEIPVSLLDHQSTEAMLRKLANASGVDAVAGDLIDKLFSLSGGHPLLARLIAAETFRKRRATARMDLTDLYAGLDSLDNTDSVGSFIRSNLWEPMTPAEKEVTASLSRSWLARKFSKARLAKPDYSQARASLKSQGIAENGEIRIELLRRWIRANVSA